MHILSRELLVGPAPTQNDSKELGRYLLRMARIKELESRRATAIYANGARAYGLTHREIGEMLGHTEGWARQYLKDIEGKKHLEDFADAGFRGNHETHNQFFEDIKLAKDTDQKLHLCAEYRLSDAAVAAVLCIPESRVTELMEGPRAEAAA
ncbi:MAG TPA: hypothetical protein DCR15_08710 [Arthrobacter bacterium]|jgi:hypothetical protein|nr:hypothetical protein [Arthrobacter sp.]